MIETKILGDAPGIQNQGLIDKTESTSLLAMTNAVIVGRFKRGRMDKAMVVTANNYQAVLGYDPSNPSYMALEDIFALGVGQVMVLRTGSSVNGANGGMILCTPSNAFIPRFDEDLPEEWITVSRNGGEFVSFDLMSENTDFEEFARLTAFGQDGKSVAFVDYPYMIESITSIPPSPLGEATLSSLSSADALPQYYYSFLGINTDGIIDTYDGKKDLKELRLPYGFQDSHFPNKPRSEHNWLIFKPTPNVDPDNDLFYKMGAVGDTLEVHSCAVMEKYIDPNACVPTYNELLFDTRNGDVNPVGEVHAKYRINGGAWEYYTDNDPEAYNVIYRFFESIYYNDWQMIRIGGGGGQSAFTTGYHRANVYGASETTPFIYDQASVVAPIAHTIEFAVTENSPNDLVYLAFGEDTTIHSCAIGDWMGY